VWGGGRRKELLWLTWSWERSKDSSPRVNPENNPEQSTRTTTSNQTSTSSPPMSWGCLEKRGFLVVFPGEPRDGGTPRTNGVPLLPVRTGWGVGGLRSSSRPSGRSKLLFGVTYKGKVNPNPKLKGVRASRRGLEVSTQKRGGRGGVGTGGRVQNLEVLNNK